MITNNTISALGRKEAQITARLSYEEKDIVTAKELDSYLPADFKYRKQLVYSLKKKRILIPVKRGVYIFVPLKFLPNGRIVNEFLIPQVFLPQDNYYIGYSTMFNYYDFFGQQFQTLYVLNTTICREREIAGLCFKFVKIPSKRMYGLEKIVIEDREVIVSSKERTLIDLIYFNKPVGGIVVASKIFERFVKEKNCDIKKLVEYAARFPNKKTRKLIGLILEKAQISDTVLRPLERSVKNTSLISFSESRRGKINKRWRVIIDDSIRHKAVI